MAPTELERTQDMHTGQLARCVLSRGTLEHRPRTLDLQPPEERPTRREGNADRPWAREHTPTKRALTR